MADAAQPWNDDPAAPATPAAPGAAAPSVDPLEGDWSDGLLGAAREHGLPLPVQVRAGAGTPLSDAPTPARRSAEELVAEAAGKLPLEALRTEQASAASLFAAPSVHVSPSIHVDPSLEAEVSPAVAVAPSIQSSPAVQVEAAEPSAPPVHDDRAPPAAPALDATASASLAAEPAPSSGDLDPLLAVASDIRRALAAEDPAHPHASRTPPDLWAALRSGGPPAGASTPGSEREAATPETAAAPIAATATTAPEEDLWAQSTAVAGPDVWAAAAPAAGAWEAGPAAAASPDWGAVSADPSASQGWEPPPPTPFTEATTLESQRQANANQLSGDEDLPVAVPEADANPERPSYLTGEPRVVVHTLAGRVKRGTLRSSDLGEAELRLASPVGGEERIAIGEVKAVFFMLSPGEQPPIAPGGRVRITLSDGRQLDGFREGDGPGGGVFIVPLDASRTNTRAIFVCGDAIQAVDQA